MKVKVKLNLIHDGTSYVPGDELDMREDIATGLTRDGVVELKQDEPVSGEGREPSERMTKVELKAIAEEKGIEVNDDMTKADIVAKIKGE